MIGAILQAKRDGRKLSEAQIEEFVAGVARDAISDAQIAAFTMAATINGLDADEIGWLTRAMGHSGEVVAWDEKELGGPVLDKHSSGGVGDKVSIILAPLVAACGGFVPMASGRGLEHTGGTLDKLEAIAGYTVQPEPATLRRTLADAGCAIVGAGPTLAPADRRLYAVRDVTATTEATGLIVASILSKKIALGARRMVMDVKVGSGAFMADLAAGLELGTAMLAAARPAGIELGVLISDMNAPLGRNAGNALEIDECVAILTGEEEAEPRLRELTCTLAAQMLVQGELAPDLATAQSRVAAALASGKAAECFERMVAGLGGLASICSRRPRLPKAATTLAVHPATSGVVVAIDVKRVGYALVDLGAGRRQASDKIDHGVGMENLASVGDEVGPTKDARPLGVVHARDQAAAARAAAELVAAYALGEEATALPVVREKLA